jgi:hypothetical protein
MRGEMNVHFIVETAICAKNQQLQYILLTSRTRFIVFLVGGAMAGIQLFLSVISTLTDLFLSSLLNFSMKFQEWHCLRKTV